MPINEYRQSLPASLLIRFLLAGHPFRRFIIFFVASGCRRNQARRAMQFCRRIIADTLSLRRCACVINWLTTTNGRDTRQMAPLNTLRQFATRRMACDWTLWYFIKGVIFGSCVIVRK